MTFISIFNRKILMNNLGVGMMKAGFDNHIVDRLCTQCHFIPSTMFGMHLFR